MFGFSSNNVWGIGGISGELIVNGTTYVKKSEVERQITRARQDGKNEILEQLRNGVSLAEILEEHAPDRGSVG